MLMVPGANPKIVSYNENSDQNIDPLLVWKNISMVCIPACMHAYMHARISELVTAVTDNQGDQNGRIFAQIRWLYTLGIFF
jgi:hypothetical protein